MPFFCLSKKFKVWDRAREPFHVNLFLEDLYFFPELALIEKLNLMGSLIFYPPPLSSFLFFYILPFSIQTVLPIFQQVKTRVMSASISSKLIKKKCHLLSYTFYSNLIILVSFYFIQILITVIFCFSALFIFLFKLGLK